MPEQPLKPWQLKLHQVIYESNTPAGKAFDVSLLVLIVASIFVVMLDSIESMHQKWGDVFWTLEWIFTGIFTVEYLLRLISIKKPWHYIVSFLGIIDLLAIIPSYLSIFLVGAQSLLVLRALRLLRIFRIFKLTHFLSEIVFLLYNWADIAELVEADMEKIKAGEEEKIHATVREWIDA